MLMHAACDQHSLIVAGGKHGQSLHKADRTSTSHPRNPPPSSWSTCVTQLEVLKNTASLADVENAAPDAILISPGPGHPKNDRDVGVTVDVLRSLSPEIPTLGVCLGLEAAVYEYGGTVGHAPEPIHGKAFPVDHDGEGVFRGLDQGFRAGRYHSLAATEVPDVFEVTATTDHDGEPIVMGIRHREYPIEAVQFHPESVLTAAGHDVIRNFLTSV